MKTPTRTVRVTFSNDGGVLDHCTLHERGAGDLDARVTKAVLAMIEEAGFLSPGDTISIREID